LKYKIKISPDTDLNTNKKENPLCIPILFSKNSMLMNFLKTLIKVQQLVYGQTINENMIYSSMYLERTALILESKNDY